MPRLRCRGAGDAPPGPWMPRACRATRCQRAPLVCLRTSRSSCLGSPRAASARGYRRSCSARLARPRPVEFASPRTTPYRSSSRPRLALATTVRPPGRPSGPLVAVPHSGLGRCPRTAEAGSLGSFTHGRHGCPVDLVSDRQPPALACCSHLERVALQKLTQSSFGDAHFDGYTSSFARARPCVVRGASRCTVTRSAAAMQQRAERSLPLLMPGLAVWDVVHSPPYSGTR